MNAPKYSRLAPGQRREQILDAANALFAQRAYDAVSIEDIASSAGVTRGLVHHYFGGRKDVYIALLERLGAQREDQIRPPIGRSARARVADSVSRWLDWTESNHTIYLATMDAARTSPIPTSGASSPSSCSAPSRCSRPFTPTSPKTHRGCATHWNAGPHSTAPPHDTGYADKPPARPRTSYSPPPWNTSCAPTAPHPRHAGAHDGPVRASRPLRVRPRTSRWRPLRVRRI